MRWEKTDSFYTLGARLRITEACGDRLTQFSAVVHYEVGAFSNEGQRQMCCIAGHQLIPISSAESSPFVERVQHESGYDGVYFQCLSDWHDTCLSKGLRSAGGRLLSRWHVARTGIGSKRIDEEIIHGLTSTDV
jgi:hypothetical protein